MPTASRTVAVLSDVHGDMLALARVIAHLEASAPVNEVVLGGDLAQGGAQPAEVIDEIRRRGWRSVRGNADDLLVKIADGATAEDAVRDAEATHGKLPKSMAVRARRSVDRLGAARIEFLRGLPTAIELGTSGAGRVVLVHATPWSTETVVLPDASAELAERMLREGRAQAVLYGHIHTQYHRRLALGAVASVGGISGSNDADPRPAYSVVTIGDAIVFEPRRVDWPVEERRAAYRDAGAARFLRDRPGPLPVRVEPGVAIELWP